MLIISLYSLSMVGNCYKETPVERLNSEAICLGEKRIADVLRSQREFTIN